MTDIRAAIEEYMNFIYIEMDGTIWGSRYSRKVQASEGSGNTYHKLIAATNTLPMQAKEIKLPDMVDKAEIRFIGTDLEIVTKTGRPYKELIVEKLLTGGKK